MPFSSALGTAGLQNGVCTSSTRPVTPYEGQMVYETDTDMLAIWNGSSWRYVASTTTTNGAVLQVVTSGPAFGDQAVSSTSETMMISNLGTITPKSSSSKIIILFTFGAYPTNFASYYNLWIRRGATGVANKIASNQGVWGEWTHNFQVVSNSAFGANAHQQYSISAWDTAGTTSTITYSLTGRNDVGSGSLILWSGAVNRLILMEVAG